MRTELVRSGLGYVMHVPDLATTIGVDRLSRQRGELHGELRVSCALPGTRSRSGLLHQARFNLSGSEARSRLAKTLAWRANTGDGVDWFELLEELCLGVLAEERRGEPIVLVGALPRPLEKPYRLDPILPLGDPVILYGEGGVGKSTLAGALGVAVESGVATVPGWVPRRAPVLYLDWESGPTAINERIAAVAAGANIPGPVQLRYRFMQRPLHDQAEDLAAVVAAEAIGLVIVDSVGLAAGISGEGGDAAESAWRLFGAFRLLRTSVLAVDHITKAAADDPNRPSRPYGSAYKGYLARATFELRRVDTPDGAVLGVYNTKYNDRRRLGPMALAVHHSEDRIAYERADELPETLTAPLPLADRIASVLAYQRLAVREIAELVNAKEANVRTTLNRDRARRFSQLPSGVWEVVGKEASRAS